MVSQVRFKDNNDSCCCDRRLIACLTCTYFSGNDDLGTMSAHILFSSLGFYPQAGTNRFFVGSPTVGSARIFIDDILSPDSQAKSLNTTRIIEVTTYDNSIENVYVSRLLINGVEIAKPYFFREDLFTSAPGDELDGGEGIAPLVTKLEYYMSPVAKSGLCSSF